MTLVERARKAQKYGHDEGNTDLTLLVRLMADRIEELEGEVHLCPTCGEKCVECQCSRDRIAALEEAMRDVLSLVWAGSPADRRWWNEKAQATFDRAVALVTPVTASDTLLGGAKPLSGDRKGDVNG